MTPFEKQKWYKSKAMLILFIVVALNIFMFVFKNFMAYYYIFYISDFQGDKQRLLFSGSDGSVKTLALSDGFFVMAGTPDKGYLVYGDLFIYKGGIIQVEKISYDKKRLINMLYAQNYISDVYTSSACSVYRYVKPLDGVDYDHVAFITDAQISLSFNRADGTEKELAGVCRILTD